MSATLTSADQVFITNETVLEAQKTQVPDGSSVSIKTSEGDSIPLSANLQEILLQALSSIAASGEVTIGRIPEELTSTTAADILGVSRPTLMKWAREGKISSFKVRSHTRFKRDEVIKMKADRDAARNTAFNELRSTVAENLELFDD